MQRRANGRVLAAAATLLALGGLPFAGLASSQTLPRWGHPVLPKQADRPIPVMLRGITLDSVARLPAILASARALRSVPTVRLVLNPGASPGDYAPAISHLRSTAYVMAELLDSEAVRAFSVSSVK